MKISVIILAVLALLPICNLQGQQIWHTYVPTWSNPTENLHGKVNVNPAEHSVAGYIFVEEANGWWTKPTFLNPTVPVLPDSTFVLNFTTGGLDRYCTRIITFLIPTDYSPPKAAGMPELPDSLFLFPYYISVRPHGDRIIEWSGLDWIVKRSVNNDSIGPGPNIFSSEETHVFVDENDNLHLSIKPDNINQWVCSEVIADTVYGYGIYTFDVQSRVDNLELYSVLGLFTWDDIAPFSQTKPEQYFREIDIEFSYWDDPDNDVGQYVIQPHDNPGNLYKYPMPPLENTIHQFEWRIDTVIFRSLTADSTLIADWIYIGTDVPVPEFENARINLWLYKGTPLQQEVEVIVSGFTYQNLLEAPVNLVASDDQPIQINLSWNSIPGLYYGIYRGLTDNPLKATLLTQQWISGNYYNDQDVEPEVNYYYWVRASDNITGSNSTGYSSGFSEYDIGIAIPDTQPPTNRQVEHLIIANEEQVCFDAIQTITVADFVIHSGGSATFIAGNQISFLEGTTVMEGGHLHAYITVDNIFCTQPTGMPVAKEADEMFEDQITEQVEKEHLFTLYPNPTTGILTLEITNQDHLQKPVVHVFSIFGENILQQIFTGGHTHELNLSEQPPGLYFVRVIIGEKTEVFKIIKK